MLKRVHHLQLTIPTGAESEARQFYCGLLQLKEIEKPKSLQHKGGFWTVLDSIQIHISIQHSEVNRLALNAHICFEVSDLEFWRCHLRNHDVALETNETIPEGVRFMARDPFGNRLEFLQIR